MGATKVADMKERDYAKWVKKNEGKIRVITVQTKSMGALYGMYGPWLNPKRILVTYEEV